MHLKQNNYDPNSFLAHIATKQSSCDAGMLIAMALLKSSVHAHYVPGKKKSLSDPGQIARADAIMEMMNDLSDDVGDLHQTTAHKAIHYRAEQLLNSVADTVTVDHLLYMPPPCARDSRRDIEHGAVIMSCVRNKTTGACAWVCE